MTDPDFLHDATNKLTVIYFHLCNLQKDSVTRISEPSAIETRDLCASLLHKIDMFCAEHRIKSIES